ncbi:hypothetical protein PSA7680_01459 [Pseudoruegeria aquimaris]|uniref:DUF3306 domain-containing protein n=1 Tax=Pseudoruegeria aquimaris TaxID=393663 RepID=A0A1Y5S3Q3_9RHOB|nr:DUF3306 domain-containing protein [Pseudoruegeria aquimaris]SLN30495.1 hypothetical protein PSA7680_01459 [Pseudoruegeria aquimaris]
MSRSGDFWSRRKAAVEAEEAQAAAARDAARAAEEEAAREAAQAEMSDAEILAELDLPDPDTLSAGDDFSAFMAKAVPEHLRRRALRRLWVSNPTLANLDSLVDYGEDFTDAANVVETLQTSYQVGKGMLKHVQEMARQAAEKAEARAASEAGEAEAPDAEAPLPEEDAPILVSAASEDARPEPLPPTHAMTQAPAAPAEPAAPARRRMRFEFDTLREGT